MLINREKIFLFPFQSVINLKDREILNGHKSGLIWYTGLSGSGKSTVAHAVEAKLHENSVRNYVLDGDNIRCGLNKDLGLSTLDRKENIRRIAEVSKLMVDAGILVSAAFIAPFQESRQFVRQLMTDFPYFEIYISCSLKKCEERDPKGLYKKAREGILKNMTGISSPYEVPESPDLIIDTEHCRLDDCIRQVIDFLKRTGIIY